MIEPIPEYYRGKAGRGAHVWCNICKTTKTHQFCKHSRSLVYKSHPWNRILNKITHRKSWPEIKTFKKFRRAHEDYLRKLEDSNFHVQIKPKVKKFSFHIKSCSMLFIDYMEGRDIPPQSRKHFNESTIDRYVLHYNRFIASLKERGYQTHLMTIYDITDIEVGVFHDYIWTLPGINKNATHNEHMKTIKGLFDHLIDYRKISIQNPFDTYTRKPTAPKKIYIEQNEFDYLLSLITKENGNHAVSRTKQGKPVNMFKDYLKDAFELALLTYSRKTDVFHIKWSNVLPSVVEIPNIKTSSEEDRVLYFAPRTAQLNALLERLGEQQYIHTDKYLLCPERTASRLTLSNNASRGFTHYWGLTGYSKKATFHSLRSTGITRMEILLGKHVEELDTHANKETREKFYVNEKRVLTEKEGGSFW